MKQFDSITAFNNLHTGGANRTSSLPHKTGILYNEQYDGVGFIPKHTAKFNFSKGEKVFTIGSCFAREIEYHLAANGFTVPVFNFRPSIQTFPFNDKNRQALPISHMFNEYNLGTMLQRVKQAADLLVYPVDSGKQPFEDNKFIDLFLHPAVLPVTEVEFNARRREITTFYKELLDSDIIIITLGLIECWYDNKYDVFLNKTPSQKFTDSEPGRFEFHQLTYEEVLEKTTEMMELLRSYGKPNKRILLTVSPVPLEATFTGQNCILATSYSKSVLRVVAETLYKRYDYVDYFPSYEMVVSRGCNGGYKFDNVHVDNLAVEKIMKHMLEVYVND
jgi:hypothetical protein